MKVRISYTVCVDDEMRRAIDYYLAATDESPYYARLASRDEVARFYRYHGEITAPIALQPYQAAVKEGKVIEEHKQKRCSRCGGLWFDDYLRDGVCIQCLGGAERPQQV